MKGLKPSKVDPRDKHFSHGKLFGAAPAFPDNLNLDNGLQMPDQNAENRPTACTAYTITEIIADEDGYLPSHDYQLMQTFELMGVAPDNDGADLRTAFKVPVSIGSLPADDEPSDMFSKPQAWAANRANWPTSFDQEAAKMKKPAYIPIMPGFGQDWFDAVRSAMVVSQEKRSVGVGTQWSPDFESRIISGVLPENPSNLQWGHAYKIVGWKTIGGSPYLIAKTWQGKNYGDGGYAYISRKLFNRLMGTWGTYAATFKDVADGTLAECRAQNVSLTDALLAFMKNLYLTLRA